MSIRVTHTATCDYCGKSTDMTPINPYVLDAGYKLPTGWFREIYRPNIIMCPNCAKERLCDSEPGRKSLKSEPVKSKWQETTAFECEHCHNLFRDDLKQCPWCGAEMTNGTTNYR